MPSSLRDNITSAYISAGDKLRPQTGRRRIVAYVESYDDVSFWRSLFEGLENDKCYFQVMLPSNTSLAKGKKMVLLNTLNTDELGKSLIACVDSDYDFLLQDATSTSRKINGSKFIFQTYAYAIENHHCFAGSLHEICVQATLNDRAIFDFEKFLTAYSEIAYPLFLWNIWFYRQHDTHAFPMNEFNSCTRIRYFSLNNPTSCLKEMEKNVNHKLRLLERHYPALVDKVKDLGDVFHPLGLTPQTTYLYMQGHHIMDNVVMKLLIPVCTVLRREREEDIKRLAAHDQQYRNELTAYQNSLSAVEQMLKKSVPSRTLFLNQWVREDIKEFVENI